MTTIESSSKLLDLLETAQKLFFKHGIRRVSVEEICSEAGVSKMTFYKYYSNKGAIAKALLLQLSEEGLEKTRSVMSQEIPFSGKVKKLLQLKLDSTEDMSQEFVKDIYNNKKLGLHEVIEAKSKESLDYLLCTFKEAADRGEIRKGIKSKFIVYFINKITEMSTDETLLALYQNEQELIMELTNFFFYGLGIQDETTP